MAETDRTKMKKAPPQTVLFKAVRHSVVYDPRVTLGDIGRWECPDGALLGQIKKLPLHSFMPKTVKSQLEFFSVLEVVRRIHIDFPQAEISILGDEDFIVEYRSRTESSAWAQRGKLIILCVLVFFGAAFTIMAFNNDVDVAGVFSNFYLQLTGGRKPAVSELEIAYSLGLTVGILVFFNHLGHRKFSADPTPIQVEVAKFHRDMDDTLLENAQREGHEEDVS